MIKIFYGRNQYKLDITNICLNKLVFNNKIIIPSGSKNRDMFFSDPKFGVHKYIYVFIDEKKYLYPENWSIEINLLNSTIIGISNDDLNSKLQQIQTRLKIKYGDFNTEEPEQKMALRYLTGIEKILEIGGNIGRNSLIISSILGNDCQMVTLECNSDIACQLKENRDLNNLDFHIENSALSKRKLIQKGWDTFPSEVLLPEHSWVNTITLDELKNKYNIEFDTLVLDCEGAFYYILMDMPEIIDNIKLIIMENDYHNIEHKTYIDKKLQKENFYRVFVESGGWGPCTNNFFEVWKKM